MPRRLCRGSGSEPKCKLAISIICDVPTWAAPGQAGDRPQREGKSRASPNLEPRGQEESNARVLSMKKLVAAAWPEQQWT